MTFFKLKNQAVEIGIDEIKDSVLTAGYISSGELAEIAPRFGFSPETVEACQRANPVFRTGAEVYNDYTFSELRIVNESGDDDWIGVCLKKNLLLVVDIIDYDGSTKNSFLKAVQRTSSTGLKPEKTFCVFLESLIADGSAAIENMRNTISDMEESVVTGKVEDAFNTQLLEIKKKLLRLYNYYDQILDVATTLEDNDNEIFRDEDLVYLTNLSAKVTRLRSDVDSLSDSADHLQDAYSSFLDMKMNRSMKILTVITTAFFPLTIIVGWYGMNFQSMPEFTWRYGYIYVIVLSVVIVAALVAIARKHKWF